MPGFCFRMGLDKNLTLYEGQKHVQVEFQLRKLGKYQRTTFYFYSRMCRIGPTCANLFLRTQPGFMHLQACSCMHICSSVHAFTGSSLCTRAEFCVRRVFLVCTWNQNETLIQYFSSFSTRFLICLEFYHHSSPLLHLTVCLMSHFILLCIQYRFFTNSFT